jgi:hypothetical protein
MRIFNAILEDTIHILEDRGNYIRNEQLEE